jgi:type I restriction enzyme S subunit
MSSDWPIQQIQDVCSVGDGAHSKVQRTEAGIPYLTVKNIGHGNLKLDKYDYISKDSFEKLFPLGSKATRRPKAGDLLIGIIGTLGNAYIYKETDSFGFSSSIGILRPNQEKILPRYLYYVLTGPEFKSTHAASNGGSAQGYTNIPAIKKLRIHVPPLQAQDAIASFLGLLDERISVLSKTSATLESIAQALFKSWLVDFDPVRAKMAGQAPVGMDEDAAALFPDKLEESELGMKPEGWDIRHLSDVLQARNERVGQLIVPEYSSTNDGVVPREKIYTKQLSASSAKNKIIRRGNLVFGLSRQVLNFGQMKDEIGSVSAAYKVFQVQPQEIIPELLGRLIRTRSAYFFNAVSASSREGQSVSSDALGLLGFVQPPMHIQEKLWEIMYPLLSKAELCQHQAESLEKIRDELLPKLLSGAIPLS